MKQIFVIYGERDSGKSHTMWLLLCKLLKHGAKIIGPMYHVIKPYTYEEVMAERSQLPDFRAVVEWNGKRIMLLSAGDYLIDCYWGFRMHMEWANEQGVDYVVCCSRSRNRKGSIYRELMDVYRGNLLADEDWFWVEKVDKDSDWLLERDKTANKILAKLEIAVDK